MAGSMDPFLNMPKATKSSSDDANVKEVGAAIEAGAEAAVKAIGKALLGMNVSGVGSTAPWSGLDSEGIQGKNIPSLMTSLNPSGGVLAQILAVFSKNGLNGIVDHTGGVGGNAHDNHGVTIEPNHGLGGGGIQSSGGATLDH